MNHIQTRFQNQFVNIQGTVETFVFENCFGKYHSSSLKLLKTFFGTPTYQNTHAKTSNLVLSTKILEFIDDIDIIFYAPQFHQFHFKIQNRKYLGIEPVMDIGKSCENRVTYVTR